MIQRRSRFRLCVREDSSLRRHLDVAGPYRHVRMRKDERPRRDKRTVHGERAGIGTHAPHPVGIVDLEPDLNGERILCKPDPVDHGKDIRFQKDERPLHESDVVVDKTVCRRCVARDDDRTRTRPVLHDMRLRE